MPYDVSKDVAINFIKNIQFENTKETSTKSKKLNDMKEIIPFDAQFAKSIFRVFQFQNEGYVIVSSSKNQFPILAYSENESLEINKDFLNNKPLQDWINFQKESIENLNEENNINPAIKVIIDSTWIAYSAPPIDEEIIVGGGVVDEELLPLLSTQWNQGCGYNDLLNNCSSGGECGNVWTGCVATALAQIMRYHEYPSSYNWSSMPNNSGSFETAELMEDIGYAVDMNYGCDGSSAYMSDAVDALKNEFGYSSSVSLQNFNKEIIWQQLEYWHNPVILSGGTHAWVTDGYRRKKHIYISIIPERSISTKLIPIQAFIYT